MAKPENPNAFKHWISADLLKKMAAAIYHAEPHFNKDEFIVIAPTLNTLELKARVRLIRDQLRKQLPQDYQKALKILLQSLQSKTLKGFDLWPYTEFIQSYGLEHPKASLEALRELTCLFTSEFAVRPFLIRHQEETLRFLKKCSQDQNVHVRRWVSEGTRPRLPWGEKLHSFVKDPSPVIPLLNTLRNDPELYVRKSIANHLNDISKDNPQLTIRILKQWNNSSGDTENIQWITRHALRTLIKAGHPDALKLLGAKPAKVKITQFKLNGSRFKLNDRIEFSFLVHSRAKTSQKLIVDYVIHHAKLHGKSSPKVFKLKTLTLSKNQEILIQKIHSLKPITTRKYYPGKHAIEIQINGEVQARKEWNFISIR